MIIAQLRAARALVGWSQDELATHSGVSKPTIARLEAASGDLGGYQGTRDKLKTALEGAGILFIDENGEGPGVRLRKHPARADHPKPTGPATDAIQMMDAAIAKHRGSKTPKRDA